MTARRLAAILAADVVGYSRLVSANETDALARLRALRLDIIEPNITKHSGRLFKIMGDGFLAEFASAVQAVTCAIAIQTEAEKIASELEDTKKMRLRIGIHVGDVMVEGDDLMGDGVNIASRLESIAAPGGISISRAVHDQVRDRIDAAFNDTGEIALKNIARPVQVFALAGPKPAMKPAEVTPTLALPDRPSIAVLPFQNMSGDPEQEYFADGIVEDIITSLSKVPKLFVIARNSTFTYKNKAVDVRQVARELSVRYVLEGSVRRSGGRLRVTAQLIDATTGNHVWAERYDRPVREVFELQDEITKEIVLALSVELTDGERSLVFSRSTRSLDAWLAAIRGFDHWMEGSPKGIREARTHFEHAIAMDPNYTLALAFIGWTHYTEMRFGFSPDPQISLAKADEIAEKCVAMSPGDAQAHGLRSGVWVLQGRFADAVRESEIAVAASPSDAFLQVVFDAC
jgi:adenylate cyclase